MQSTKTLEFQTFKTLESKEVIIFVVTIPIRCLDTQSAQNWIRSAISASRGSKVSCKYKLYLFFSNRIILPTCLRIWLVWWGVRRCRASDAACQTQSMPTNKHLNYAPPYFHLIEPTNIFSLIKFSILKNITKQIIWVKYIIDHTPDK